MQYTWGVNSLSDATGFATPAQLSIWEEIKSIVCWKTDRLVEGIHEEIPKDTAIAEFQAKQPIPWQLREIMEQRANAWVQRVYDLCCDAYKNRGNVASKDFDRAVWAYCIEPFIMGQKEADIHHERMSGFLELLLCAVGSPREKRRFLTVSQKDCCLQVRTNVFDTWNARLHHRLSRMDEAVAAIARYNEVEARARRIVAGLPPDLPPQQSPTSPLPSATIIGANINEFVAWDGKAYVLRPTKESVLADEGLKLIGSVRELSRIRRFSPGYVFVQNPSQGAPGRDCMIPDAPPPQPPPQAPSLAQLIAPMPPHVSPVSSAPHESLSARTDELATPVRPSAPEPVLSPLSPAQKDPETEPQAITTSNRIAKSSSADTATREDIEISFLSDERIHILNGTKLETRNYAEFGFEDRRSGKPNQAWETLRALAEHRGLIQAPIKAHQDWSQVEKRIQEIRKILRNHFSISSDPIRFVEGAGYQALFKIGCSLSYQT